MINQAPKYIKQRVKTVTMISLPRQARDKHRESTQKETRFSQTKAACANATWPPDPKTGKVWGRCEWDVNQCKDRPPPPPPPPPPSPPSPVCTADFTKLQENMDTDGVNLPGSFPGAHPSDCCALCEANKGQGCNGFSFLGAACYLKQGITKFLPNKPGVVSAMTKKAGGHVVSKTRRPAAAAAAAAAQQQVDGTTLPPSVQKIVSPSMAMGAKNAAFCAIYTLKRSFYQDSLGTNIGENSKKSGVFRRRAP
jgi:hypothetical protein